MNLENQVINNEKGTEGLIGRFPFVMVLTTTFLRGILFVLLNLPLISPVIQSESYPTLANLLLNAHLSFARTIVSLEDSTGSFLLIFLIISIALGIGLILEPVERGISYIIILPINIYKANRGKRMKREIESQFFNSSMMLSPDYSRLLEWFFIHTNQRSHWEWELFHYYISWSIFVNLAIYSGLSIYLLRSSISFVEVIVILIGNLAFLIFALLRCKVMANVHRLYIDRSRQ